MSDRSAERDRDRLGPLVAPGVTGTLDDQLTGSLQSRLDHAERVLIGRQCLAGGRLPSRTS